MKLKKILLIIFGIVISLVILEVFLCLASWVVESRLSKRDFGSGNKLKILCVGDSYTYGLGVERHDAYPAQLELLLKGKLGDEKVEVSNCGRPGMNTPQLAEYFMEIMDNYRPDIVLVMIGTNDEWNFDGFLNPPKTISDKISLFVRSLRISRMLKIFTTVFKKPQEMNSFTVPRDENSISEMLKLIEKNGGLNNSYYYQAVMLGNEYRDKNKFDEAKLYYDCALKINPDDNRISKELLRYHKRVLTVLGHAPENDLFEKNKKNIINYIHSVTFHDQNPAGGNKFMLEMIDLSKTCRIVSLFEENLLLLTKIIHAYGFNEQIWEELDELFIAWGSSEQAIKFYQYLAQKYPDNPDLNLRLARQYKGVRDYGKVKKYFKKVLEISPGNQEAINGITSAGNFIVQRLIQEDTSADKNDELFGVKDALFKDYKKAEGTANKDKKHTSFLKDLSYTSDDSFRERLEENNSIALGCLKQICKTAKMRNVRVFFLSYPLVVSEIVQEAAKAENIPIIESKDSFVSVITPSNLKDYFLPDGHCTKKGYKIMADKAAQVLLDNLE